MPEKFEGPEKPKNPQEQGKETNDSEKVITLPNREEMLARLIKVSDNSHLQERFYPILLKVAGQERVPQGIVKMLALAIHDYTEGMPPMIANLMYMQAPGFIDALVTDPEAAKEAKDRLQEVLGGK